MHRTESAPGAKTTSRRDLLKKALVAGPIAYTAPMILGSAKPVLAQAISNPACQGATCQNFSNCNGNEACYCFSLANGSGFCGTSVQCSGLTACSLQNPCGAGFVCQVNTCCGAAGICVPAATQCAPGGLGAAKPQGSGPFTGSLN